LAGKKPQLIVIRYWLIVKRNENFCWQEGVFYLSSFQINQPKKRSGANLVKAFKQPVFLGKRNVFSLASLAINHYGFFFEYVRIILPFYGQRRYEN
jgi:hypothetical protein